MPLTKNTGARLVLSLLTIVLLYSCQKETTITGVPPVAHFTYTSVAAVPATVQFTNLSTSPAGTTSIFKWDFGDGTQLLSTDATHTYTQLGAYIVTLIQIPSSGTADSVRTTLVLSPDPGPAGVSNRVNGIQTADFNFVITSRAYTATFINTSTNAASYLWKFGDGATTTTDSSTVIHLYNTSGTYHVNLAATNSSGTDTSGAIISF